MSNHSSNKQAKFQQYMLILFRGKEDGGEGDVVQRLSFTALDDVEATNFAAQIFRKNFGPFSDDNIVGMTVVKVVSECPVTGWTEELEKEGYEGLPSGPLLVLCQDWEESERGWGTRPGGFTLHTNVEERARYIEEYYREHNSEAAVPDTYTRHQGRPRTVAVDEETYLRVRQQRTIWGNGDRGPEDYLPRVENESL